MPLSEQCHEIKQSIVQEGIMVNVLVRSLLLDGAIKMFLIYLTSVLKANPLWAELVWFGQAMFCSVLLYSGACRKEEMI